MISQQGPLALAADILGPTRLHGCQRSLTFKGELVVVVARVHQAGVAADYGTHCIGGARYF